MLKKENNLISINYVEIMSLNTFFSEDEKVVHIRNRNILISISYVELMSMNTFFSENEKVVHIRNRNIETDKIFDEPRYSCNVRFLLLLYGFHQFIPSFDGHSLIEIHTFEGKFLLRFRNLNQ